MKSFRHYITELLDQPLPWKWVHRMDSQWSGRFTTPGGLCYDVDFDYFRLDSAWHEQQYPDIKGERNEKGVELSFAINDAQSSKGTLQKHDLDGVARARMTGITGSGDELHVFATVMAIVKDFLTSNKVPAWRYIGFSAKEESRRKLYDRFAQMLKRGLPRDKFEVTEQDGWPEKSYRIIKKGHMQEEAKRGFQWVKPDIAMEREEIERTGEELGIPIPSLMATALRGKLVKLTDEMWSRMDNTDSWGTITMEQVRKLADEHDRDVDRIVAGFQKGSKMPAPIVLIRKSAPPYLIGGNTRLMVARAMEIRPMVYTLDGRASIAEQYITELLDQPLDFDWAKRSEDEWVATFITPTGLPYRVDFEFSRLGQNPYTVELTFAIMNSKVTQQTWKKLGIVGEFPKPMGITKTGDELYVFATVAAIVQDFYRNAPDWSNLRFEAREAARRRVYDNFFKLIQRRLGPGYKFYTKQDKDVKQYMVATSDYDPSFGWEEE